MKKITALLLIFVMMCSAFVAVSAANETDAPVAPDFVGAQTRVNKTDSGKYDVRFIATIDSLKGDLLGYDITATFVNGEGVGRSVVYSGEKTEGTTVYSNLMANGVSKSPTEYNEGAIAFYVFALTGLPMERDVVFSVKVYLMCNGEKLVSEENFVKSVNGEVAIMKTTYTQGFDGAAGKLLTGYDLATPYGTGMKWSVADGMLQINDTSWGSVDCKATLVNKDAFQKAVESIKGTDKEAYVVEMDLTIKDKLGCFGFILNGEGNGTASQSTTDRRNANKKNGALITFRRSGYSNGTLTADYDIALRAGYFDSNAAQKTPTTNDKIAYDNTSTSASFKFAMVINGNRIDVFVDNAWVHGYDIPDTVTGGIKDNSAIYIWAQNTVATLDNLTISIPQDGVGVVTDSDTGAKTLSARTATYTQTYSTMTDDTYGLSIPCTTALGSGREVKITDDGQLYVVGGGWGDNFVALADGSKMKGEKDAYIVDMDMAIESISTLSVSLINKVPTGTVSDIYSDIKATGVSVRLINVDEDTLKVYLQAYKDDGTLNETDPNKTVDVRTNENGQKLVKLRIIASDSTYSLYIDGVHVVSFKTADDRSSNENTHLMLWTQGSKTYIDNLAITTVVTEAN